MGTSWLGKEAVTGWTGAHQGEEASPGWHTGPAAVLPRGAGNPVMEPLEMPGPPETAKILSRAQAEQVFPVLHLLFLGFSEEALCKSAFP